MCVSQTKALDLHKTKMAAVKVTTEALDATKDSAGILKIENVRLRDFTNESELTCDRVAD